MYATLLITSIVVGISYSKSWTRPSEEHDYAVVSRNQVSQEVVEPHNPRVQEVVKHSKLRVQEEDVQSKPGLHRVAILGDGNCLFRALAYPSNDHIFVREHIMRHIRNNWDTYRNFLEHSEQRDYIENGQRNGVWGDELCISAYSDTARVAVHVYDTTSKRLIRRYGTQHSKSVTYLLYNGSHYDTATHV